MKRTDLIKKLINEGFSEKTLVSLSDKQINMLSVRILKEDDSLTIKQDDLKKINPTNIVNKTVRIVPESEISECGKKSYVKEEGQVDECGSKPKSLDEKTKPSEGLTKKQKSGIVKKAKKGEDVGKKGKGFEKVVKSAKKSGAKNSKAVAAAAMWKNVPRNESVEKSQITEWLENLVENQYYSVTTKNEIMELVQTKLKEQLLAEPDIETPVKEPKTRPSEPTKEPGKRPFKEPWKTPGPGPDPRPKMETPKLPEFLFFSNIVKSTKNN